ncbi:phage/plasmid replication protein, II/X family [Rheinheimera sp.]|uniref:phage/plasmid replication protein, II/X family n=1 Tax=Rheinheimera sp. TaxID=1869214 RepID=UPI00307E881F
MSLMIDWQTCLIPLRHKRIHNGHLFNVDAAGELRWEVAQARQLQGSYESSCQVKSNDLVMLPNCNHEPEYADTLYLHGNPTKFLQGHNIVGTSDLNQLTLAWVKAIGKTVGFEVDVFTEKRILSGDYIVKRLDLNAAFELPSFSDVRAYLDAQSVKTKTRHGRSTVKKGTVYFGQHSRRWSVKMYSKFEEIIEGKKGHRVPPQILNSPLVPWTENKVRIELVLRAAELKKLAGTDDVKALHLLQIGLQNIYQNYLGRLDMTANIQLKDEQLLKLPRKVQGTYSLWSQGHDVRSMMAVATFYRHRDELKPFGIDISLPYDGESKSSNVVPLLRVLDAQPCSIPADFQRYIVH